MKTLRNNCWKVLVLSIIATIIDIAGHIIDGTPLPNDPLSLISKAIGIEGAVSVYFIICFSSISITFLIIEKWLPGNWVKKGLSFGISWALIMYATVCEMNTILGTSIIADIRMAFADAIPLIVLGILLGKVFASENRSSQFFDKKHIVIFLIITLFYLIGRYFAYSIIKIESGYSARPFSTFIWTISTGMTFGILYLFVGQYTNKSNPIKKVVLFGTGIMGVNWLIFNLFIPFIFQVSLSKVLVNIIGGRVIIDIVFITLGIYTVEKILNKYEVKSI